MKDMFNQRQRYSLRKYSFGVASVLLGVTLLSASQTAQAEEVNSSAPTSTTITRADTDKPEAVDVSATITTTEVIPESGVGADTSAVASTITSESSFLDSELASTSALETSEAAYEVTSTSASTVGIPARAVATPATASMPRTAGFSGVVGTSIFTTGVTTVSASDANDPMPTGEYTNTSIPNIATDPDVPKNLSVGEVLAGNTVTAPSLAGTLGALAINDSRKRIALIASVSGQDGQTLERYYRASVDFDTKNYMIDEFDSSFNQFNSYSIASDGTTVITPFGVGADKPTITLRSKSDEGVTFIFTRAENWDTVNKYSIKVDYAAVMRSILPTYFSADSSDSNVNQSDWNQSLPFPSEVRINYLEKGSGTQLANSNVIPALIGDHYVTIDATDSNFFTQFQNKGYELVESPVYANGTINATYWGGKGFVALNEIINTVNGQTRTFVVRRTVVNEDGDITIEMWDKASGVKLPVKGYTTTAGTPEYTDYDTVFVSKPIRPSDETLTSSSIYTKVDFIWKDENGLIGYIGPNRVPHSDIINDVNSASGTVLLSNWTNSWKPSGGELTYWYTRPKGDVTVEYYIEGSNTKIATDQKAADQVSVKETYDASTSALRPATITYNGQTYRLVLDSNNEPVLKSGSAAVTGTVEKATQSVQYQYRLVQRGSVDVVYKAEDGTILEALSPVVTNANEGTAYTTSQKTFAGYTFKELESGSAATSGVVVGDQTLHVVYVYSANPAPVVMQKADITIVAVDAAGNAMTVARQSGTTTTAITDGILEVSSNLQGTAGSSVQTQAQAAGFDYQALIAKYQQLGYQVVSGSYTGTGSLATKGTMTEYTGAETFDNDTASDQHFVIKLTPIVVPFEPNQPVTPGQTVPGLPNNPTYPTPDNTDASDPNRLKETVTRTVSYFTEDKDGNNKTAIDQSAIASKSDTLYFRRTGTVNLVTGEVVMNGWTITDANYNTASTETTGSFANYTSPVHIGFILKADAYRAVGAHTGVQATDADLSDEVIYVPIAKYVPQWPTGDTPTTPWTEVPYTNDPTDPTKIVTPTDPGQSHIPYVPGYTPQDPNGNPLQPVDPSDPTKGYIPPVPTSATDDTVIPYTRNGEVLVKYVDENGNTLQADRVDTSDAPVGTAYDTNEAGENPTRITSTDGKIYELVRVDGNERGQVVSGTTTVTYVYRDVTPKRGNVLVKYVSDTGVTLQADRTDLSNATVGTSYNTNEAGENPVIITTADGSRYGKIRVIGNETGSVVEGDTVVTYVYTLLSSPKGSVVVEYRDEEGNVLKTSRVDLADAPVGTRYNTNEAGENPQYIDAADGIRYELVNHRGNETGSVVEGTTTVVYIYRAMGEVVVDYVDEFGNKLINSRTAQGWSSQGTAYDASTGNPQVIYRNGVRYEVERVVGQEKGKVGKGRTTVTYIYRKVDEPTTPTGPKTPGQPATPTGNVPGQSGRSSQTREDSATGRASANQQTSESVDDQEQLPETGDEGNATAAVGAGLLASLMAGLALSRKKKED